MWLPLGEQAWAENGLAIVKLPRDNTEHKACPRRIPPPTCEVGFESRGCKLAWGFSERVPFRQAGKQLARYGSKLTAWGVPNLPSD